MLLYMYLFVDYQNKLEELRKIHECEIEEREKQYTSSMNKYVYTLSL